MNSTRLHSLPLAVLALTWVGCAGPAEHTVAAAAGVSPPEFAHDVGANGTPSAQDEPAPTPLSPESAYMEDLGVAPETGVPVHGSLLVRARTRKSDAAEAHEAFATLTLDVGDPRRHAVTGHVRGRLWADLGGDDPDGVFNGLDDALDSDGMLHYAHADFHEVDGLAILRAGRQQLWDAPMFLVFDGARLETSEISGVTLGAYAGLRTQYYDTSTPDDLIGGIYLESDVWEGGRVRVDALYLEDDQRLGAEDADLLGLDVRQFVGEELTLEGNATFLDGRERDVRLRTQYIDPKSDLTVQASYYSLLRTQSQEAFEVDPYFSSLLEYRPFHQLGLVATKGVTEDLSLSLGADFRFLFEDEDEGAFNHEFDHYTLGATLEDTLHEGLEVTLTGDVWRDDQQDIETWGIDLTQHVSDDLDASLGSDYSLYEYDLFLDRERDHVRSTYARVRYTHSEGLIFDVELEHEDDDIDDYQALIVRAKWLF